MIQLEIAAEHYDLPSDLKSRIEEKFGGLTQYMDTLAGGHVRVSWEGGKNEQTEVRAQVWGPGHKFEASDTDWHAVTAIDKAYQKLEKQIRREHNKEISERDHS
jgi:ribosomal subunit interface protein